MIKTKQLTAYCKAMLLDFSIENNTLYLDEKEYEIIDSETLLFDEDFEFLPSTNSGYAVYEFNGHWFTQFEGEETTLTPLKYIGKAKQKIKINNFLGMHSGNELLNGVGLYKDWIKKAKFLGITTLGICEKNQVRGAMDFQKQCLKNGIKPVIGVSLEIKSDSGNYFVKCYAKNFDGWQNILKFTYKLNVEMDHSIEESFLKENKEGLYVIIDSKHSPFKDYKNVSEFYQLDTAIFESEEKDKEFFKNLESFITSGLKPILIVDAYYIEKQDYKVREKLWEIGKSFDFKSKNQHFKNNDEFAMELMQMFERGNKSWVKLFKEAEYNLNMISENCVFEYDTTSRHLPKYIMTEWEKSQFVDNEQCFNHYVKEGFRNRKLDRSREREYLERIKKEVDTLRKGDTIDYFLTNRDIVINNNKKGILTGIGRGSAGGCLIAYLLGIIHVDPIDRNLIFERFLNEGRMGELKECKAFLIETDEGNVRLNEKSVLSIIRNDVKMNVMVEDLVDGDDILKY